MRCGTALRKWVSRPKRSAGLTCYFKLYFTFRRRLPARQASARQRPAFAPFPGGAAESFRRSASAIRVTALREAKGRIARKKSDNGAGHRRRPPGPRSASPSSPFLPEQFPRRQRPAAGSAAVTPAAQSRGKQAAQQPVFARGIGLVAPSRILLGPAQSHQAWWFSASRPSGDCRLSLFV